MGYKLVIKHIEIDLLFAAAPFSKAQASAVEGPGLIDITHSYSDVKWGQHVGFSAVNRALMSRPTKYNTGTSTRVTKVANSTPKATEVAIGLTN